MANNRFYVEAPATFTPLPYGLLQSLSTSIRTPTDPHWQMGVNYESICEGGNTTYDDCIVVTGSGLGQPVPPSPPKAASATIDKRGATPFTVFAEIDCSAPGFWDRAEESVAEAFAKSESRQVEYAFWTGRAGGQVDVFPHLQANAAIVDESSITLQTAATVISGSAVFDIVEGLGRLERDLAECYGGQGVIHAPRSLAPVMAAYMLLIPDGNRYLTPNGNIVVFGTGYQGTGPSDASNATPLANTAWMYATGQMFIYRSPITTMAPRESINRAENSISMIAERTYVIGFECCHLAVQVSLGGVSSGAPGS